MQALDVTDSMGAKIRRQRRRLGLTLDDLAAKTSISKPYLSLIETGRVPNPPSDEKLVRIEHVLGFARDELLTQARLHRTPREVRDMLQKLLSAHAGLPVTVSASDPAHCPPPAANSPSTRPEDAILAGLLKELALAAPSNVELMRTNAVPVINKVSAGYPKDFTDLSYPKGVADEYVSCPDIRDPDAFAARVSGDSMTPKYRPGDIVIFSPLRDVKDGDDCFVRLADGQTTFKRVFFEADDAGRDTLRLQPRNESYRAKLIPADEVTGVWKAVYRYQAVEE